MPKPNAFGGHVVAGFRCAWHIGANAFGDLNPCIQYRLNFLGVIGYKANRPDAEKVENLNRNRVIARIDWMSKAEVCVDSVEALVL